MSLKCLPTPLLNSKTSVYSDLLVYLLFLFSIQNIDGGYTLEPPRRGSSNMYPQSMFRAKILKISKFFQ